jgi:hypothetical protein
MTFFYALALGTARAQRISAAYKRISQVILRITPVTTPNTWAVRE